MAPRLNFQSFEVTDTNATHVQLRVIRNQCTGTPEYQGEQDADPANNTDCDENSEQGEIVRAAELELTAQVRLCPTCAVSSQRSASGRWGRE